MYKVLHLLTILSLSCILFSCKEQRTPEKALKTERIPTEGILTIQVPTKDIAPWEKDIRHLFVLPEITEIVVEGYPEHYLEIEYKHEYVKRYGLTIPQVEKRVAEVLQGKPLESLRPDSINRIKVHIDDERFITIAEISLLHEKVRNNRMQRKGEDVLQVSMKFSGQEITTIIDNLRSRFTNRGYRGYGKYSTDGEKWTSVMLHAEESK